MSNANNLPPGVTDSMIPGNERDVKTIGETIQGWIEHDTQIKTWASNDSTKFAADMSIRSYEKLLSILPDEVLDMPVKE